MRPSTIARKGFLMITYRPAVFDDIPALCVFTDFWLSGRGMAKGVPGTSNDCFVSAGQHHGYIKKSTVLLAYDEKELIAWAVKHHNDTLIHMLVAAPYRGKGIGKTMVDILKPRLVRSKTDQSTGNPTPFYEHLGYVQIATTTSIPSFRKPRIRHKALKNIVVLQRKTS